MRTATSECARVGMDPGDVFGGYEGRVGTIVGDDRNEGEKTVGGRLEERHGDSDPGEMWLVADCP